MLDLPEADGSLTELPPDQIEVLIDRDGAYSVNGQLLINRQIETLIKALKDVSYGNTEMPLIITADANATHQAVVTAMDAAGRMGFVHLKITTIQPDGES